jgi:hypothetical protein
MASKVRSDQGAKRPSNEAKAGQFVGSLFVTQELRWITWYCSVCTFQQLIEIIKWGIQLVCDFWNYISSRRFAGGHENASTQRQLGLSSPPMHCTIDKGTGTRSVKLLQRGENDELLFNPDKCDLSFVTNDPVNFVMIVGPMRKVTGGPF